MTVNVNLLLFAFLALAVSNVSAKSVIYPGIGTYHSTDFYHPIFRPFTVFFLPEDPKIIGPTFMLFTRQNRENPDILKFNETKSIESSHFNAALPTKVLIHGFHNVVDKKHWTMDMKNKTLAVEDVNVIIVSWSRGAQGIYGQAIVNARVVGAMVGIEISAICHATSATLDSFHLLGHSLGGHVSGYAGKRLNGQLGRISGLDPAGPFFEGLKPEARLWYTDAQFVDVIHTCGLVQGMLQTCGHIDFMPNGGIEQPGCGADDLSGIFNTFSCNHARAYMMYIDAINRTVIPEAYQCDSYLKFKLGLCNSCGDNGERCAILGPRAIESKGNTEPGKRFYLASDSSRPLFGH